jgi:hypothetical protein
MAAKINERLMLEMGREIIRRITAEEQLAEALRQLAELRDDERRPS